LLVSCRDYAALVQDRFIEVERIYGLADYGGVHRGLRAWTPSTALVSGEFVTPTDGMRSGKPYFYEVTTGGTTHADEPGQNGQTAWPSSSTVTNGGVTFTYRGGVANSGYSIQSVIQALLTDNGLSAFTLTTVGTPGWNVKQFKQARMGVLEAIRERAIQIGWDVRYKWVSGAWALTLWSPDRDISDGVLATFTASQYAEISQAKIDIADIRNAVQVVFTDSTATVLSDGSYPRKTKLRLASDLRNNSITTYGRRFMD
jgi:hypothetical protein